MKIAVLGPLEYPLAEPYVGGLEKHTVQLANGLAGLGYRVTLIAGAGSRLPSNSLAKLETVGSYRQAAKCIAGRGFTILHNNSINFLPPLFALIPGIRVVTSLHVPPYRRLTPGALLSKLTGRSHFIAISATLAKQWRPYIGGSTVIHNGIEPGEWPYRKTPIAKSAIWYGRFVPEKAPHLAIAAARSANYSIKLAGPITDKEFFDQEIKPLLGTGVVYLGHLTQQQLMPEVGSASVGLYTSVWDEPFGLIIPEILACGTPIAGFRSGAAPELLNPAVSNLVKTGEVTALASAMHATAALDRRECHRYALKHFLIEGMVNAYAALYERLTYGGSISPPT